MRGEREREIAKNEREREKELCNAYTIVNDEKKEEAHVKYTYCAHTRRTTR